MQTVGSEARDISGYDWWKVFKGALIGGGGSLLTVILTWLLEALSSGKINLGPYSLILVPILSTLINAALKYFQDTRIEVKSVSLLGVLLAAVMLATPGSVDAAEPIDVSLTVVTMQGCRPCASLKKAFEQSEDLRSYKPLFVDMREFKELRTLRITSFPTLLVRTPENAVIYRRSGYDGNAKKLADEISTAIKRYKQPQRRGVRIGRRMNNDPRFQVVLAA